MSRREIISSILQQQMECPICLDNFDLLTKVPYMVCFNQHSLCASCLPLFSHTLCPICQDTMIPREARKKNRLVFGALEEYYKTEGQALK